MKPALYIFINRGLGMSPGKIAAQAGHAAVEAALMSRPDTDGQLASLYGNVHSLPQEAMYELWDAWRNGLHYAKYVMEARDSEHLRDIERYLRDRGFRTALILDEGHTEIDPIQPTALGVALVDKDDPHTEATFSSFKLFRQPSLVVVETARMSQPQIDRVRELLRDGNVEAAQEFAKSAALFEQPQQLKPRWRFW